MYKQVVSAARHRVTILANFVEVFLAKEDHAGVVGINLLTKVQMPNLPSLYGAMLAGVDYVIMGAGIPREIPARSTRWPSTSRPVFVSTWRVLVAMRSRGSSSIRPNSTVLALR
jgi:NAD(P)H-dependent flavin oxidoreductase YrpB (nitropropane dioxygenase family)